MNIKAESQEHQITRGSERNENASHRFHDQYHSMMKEAKEHGNPGGKLNTQEAKENTSNATHLDIPQLWNQGVHQAESAITGAVKQVESGLASTAKHAEAAVAGAAKQAWDNADNNPNARWIKHDVCNDSPVTAGIAGASAVGIGALGLAVVAPEAVAAGAAAVGLAAGEATVVIQGIGVVSALAGIGLKISYDNRHNP